MGVLCDPAASCRLVRFGACTGQYTIQDRMARTGIWGDTNFIIIVLCPVSVDEHVTALLSGSLRTSSCYGQVVSLVFLRCSSAVDENRGKRMRRAKRIICVPN